MRGALEKFLVVGLDGGVSGDVRMLPEVSFRQELLLESFAICFGVAPEDDLVFVKPVQVLKRSAASVKMFDCGYKAVAPISTLTALELPDYPASPRYCRI